MKKIMRKSRYTYVLYAFVFTLLFNSCSKEKNIPSGGETSTLVFTVAGVENSSINNMNKKLAVSGILEQQLNSAVGSNVQLNKNVDLAFTSEERVIETQLDIESNQKSSNVNNRIGVKVAATSPLNSGIKYRILLYNESTGSLERNVEATAGVATELEVVKGATYKWYAYSYNTEDPIASPNIVNNLPLIQTSVDKDLLWASSGAQTISTTSQNTPLAITFQHKVAEVVIELDMDRLFGSVMSIDASFNENYINTGSLDIKSGLMTNVAAVSIPAITFEPASTATPKLRRAQYYTANPTALINIQVNVNSLKVKYINNDEVDLVLPSDPPRVATFSYTSPTVGKSLVGTMKLWRNFSSRKILHVTRFGADAYAYAAQPYQANNNINSINISASGASYFMIEASQNYGTQATSIVRSGGFTHERVGDNFGLAPKLNVTLVDKPDIVIISVYYRMNAADITALLSYMDDGGVVVLLTDGVDATDRSAQEPFFRQLFNTPTITLQNNGFSRGSLYMFNNINDEILNGPFGDIRGKYWGEDASQTTSLANVPTSEITYYSDAKAANRSGVANGVTMFKHNSRHFFWMGDGGFLSNASSGGVYVPLDYGICPFATNATTRFPIPKNYGEGGTAQGFSNGATPVYNSTLFANVMSWAIVNAEFFGVKTGGIPPGGIIEF